MTTLRKLFISLFIIFALHITLYTLHSYAAIPHLINYQGRLTDKNGTPLEGAYNLTFKIYDAETAGILLWEESHPGAVIQKGIFSVLLGSVTALNIPFDKPYFLEIKVGNEVMTPRQQITSAGYAMKAEEAEKLGGKQPSEYALTADITSTPAANKAVKLDSNAKLPLSALKVYDSGWFAVNPNTSYTKTHNLGTTKVLIDIKTAQNSDGSGWCIHNMGSHNDISNAGRQAKMVSLTTAQIVLRTGVNVGDFIDSAGNGQDISTSAYARIIMLALE